MANLGVTFDFAAESAKLRNEIDKVRKEVSGLSATAKGIERGFANVGKAIVGAFSVGAIAGFISKVNSAADQLNDLSQRLGASASGLQAIQSAAALAGGSADAAATALEKMAVTLGDAAAGNKTAVQAFERLGLSVKELQGLKADEAFRKIADAVSAIPNSYERASAAQDIFGKGAKEISGLLAQGSTALDDVNKGLAEQGALLSDLDVARIGVMNDQLDFQATVVQNLGTKFLTGLTPAVNVAVDTFANFLKSLGGASSAGEGFGQIMIVAIKTIEAGAYGLVAVFETVREIIAGVLAVISGGVANLISGFSTMAGAVGLDGLAGKLGTAAEFMRGIDASLTDIAQSASINADKATAAAIKAGTEILNAGLIFAQYKQQLDAAAAEQAARNAQTQGGIVNPTGAAGAAAGATAADPFAGINAASNKTLNAALGKFDPTTDLEALFALDKYKWREEQEAAHQGTMLGLLDSFNSTWLGSMLTANQQQIDAETFKSETIGGLMANFAQTAMQQGGVLGKIGKAFAIAQTIWSTGTAVMNAMAQVPYPANIAAAAGVAAMGAMQLANIMKTNIGSGGSVASAKGGSKVSASSPVASQSPAGTQASTESQQKSAAQIIINGNLFAAQETVDWLVRQIADAVNNKDMVFIDGNSRQAMELVGP